jgi:hypothetical protein
MSLYVSKTDEFTKSCRADHADDMLSTDFSNQDISDGIKHARLSPLLSAEYGSSSGSHPSLASRP